MKYLTDSDIENFFSDQDSDPQKFQCINCGFEIMEIAPGTKNRNHCPKCLYSKHVDQRVGDRKSNCNSPMKAVGRFKRPNGEDILIHECIECGKISNNRIAGDDDYDLFLKLPISQNN